jgi:hypothetical protein
VCGGCIALKKKIEILWVDDQQKERDEDKRNIIAKQGNLKIDLIHPDDIIIEDSVFLKKEYDLYLVDIRLNEFPKEKNGSRFPFQGSTVDSIIREKYPDTLIYGLSQDYLKIAEDSESFLVNSVFDRFFSIDDIKSRGHNILYYDAMDFQQIKNAKPKDISEIFRLINIPKENEDRLKLALPPSLKKGIKTLPEGTCQAFSRWVLKVFLKTPGFLYNELYSATYLGVSTIAFKKIASGKDFTKIQYCGIFAKTNEPLWWVSSLNQRILTDPVAKSISSINPWEISPKLFHISDTDQTKCVVCEKKFPERVGININDPDDMAPVHIRCSKPYPGKEVILFFDEYRGFKL